MINYTNKAINKLRQYKDMADNSCSSLFFRLKCVLQGIKLGKRCACYGVPFIYRSNMASISIGNNCTFRNRWASNYMGLNHGCMLSATPAYKNTSAVLSIGNGCGFSGVSIWCFKSIAIGNNVRVGANTIIMDGDAHHDDPRSTPPEKIVIENDVWIGANCVIKKGVTIGQGALVGMNSVVIRNIPANAVAVGSPAKVIRFVNK